MAFNNFMKQLGKNNKELIRKLTEDDVVYKLDKFGRCALLRPTGFGKTWLVSKLSKQYNKVLYLYPSKVIRNTAVERIEELYNEDDEIASGAAQLAEMDNEIKGVKDTFKNVTFVSYLKLVYMNKKDTINTLSDYDLVILDECHKIGAEKTGEAIKVLLELLKDAHILGATATPDRSDAVDVVTNFFCGITTKEYTLHDAFQDGFIKVPYYCFFSYDVEKDLKHIAKDAALEDSISADDIRADKILKSKIIEISNLFGVDKIIKHTVDFTKESEEKLGNKYNTDYMKFIVFFDGFTAIKNKRKEVIKWFKNAFPDYEVNDLVITSESEVTRGNVDKLNELENNKCSSKIDLILCVNMLNEGYHIDSLTGIVMYRGTSSSIIFNQQFGRALSSGEGQPCIVIDIVDNLHRKNVYCLHEEGKRRDQKSMEHCDENTLVGFDTTMLSDNEKNELRKILAKIGEKDITNQDVKYIEKAKKLLSKTDAFEGLNTDDEKMDMLMMIYKYASKISDKQWWKLCNQVLPEDLHPIAELRDKDSNLTYKEILIKTLGEPVAQRCKRAGDLYYMRWCSMQKEEKYPKDINELTNNGKLIPLLNELSRYWNVQPSLVADTILKFNKEYMHEIYKKVHANGIEQCGVKSIA